MKPWLLGLMLSGLAAGRAGAGLPAEVTVTSPTRLEIITNGRPGGTIGLRAGESLSIVTTEGDFLVVRYRNLNGRVPAAHTNLPPEVEPAPAAPAVVAPPPPAPIVVAPAPVARPGPAPVVAAPERPRPPATAMERSLAGKLVALEGGVLRPAAPARLAGVQFYAIYFSASWCGPCRSFTPELIDAYGKIRPMYPEFEVVLVNRDKSPADMAAYVRDDRMPWPALEWGAIAQTREITRYAGGGIPCLVLVDAGGKVLSDSYRWGRYVGPDAVLDDTWKILRDYRRAHPRPRT